LVWGRPRDRKVPGLRSTGCATMHGRPWFGGDVKPLILRLGGRERDLYSPNLASLNKRPSFFYFKDYVPN
jgi:hypothetical protein